MMGMLNEKERYRLVKQLSDTMLMLKHISNDCQQRTEREEGTYKQLYCGIGCLADSISILASSVMEIVMNIDQK